MECVNENQLDTFLAVVRHGSYSRAAESMYLSQPTVSYRIQTLEEELGVKLFASRNFQTTLTAAGSAFVQEAQRLCEQMQAARLRMVQFSPARTLTIGFPEMMLQGQCSSFMMVMQLLPDKVATLASRQLKRPPDDVQQLQQGEVDLIFTDLQQPALEDHHFGKRTLFYDRSHVCMRRDHPLAGEKMLTLDQLRGETIRRYADTTYFLGRIEAQLGKRGMKLHDDTRYTFVQLLPQVVQRGGVIITNQRPVADARLAYVPLQLDAAIDIGIAWRKADCPPSLRQLIQKLTDLPATAWL